VTILIFAGLIALGVAMLRRDTAREFPDTRSGDAMRELRSRWFAARNRGPAVAVAGNGGRSSRLDEIERLIALHDKGDLTDAEFAAEKKQLVAGSSS
jgi:hypothetical protein